LGDSIRIHGGVRLPDEPIQELALIVCPCSPESPPLIQTTMIGDATQPAPQAAASLEPVESLKCFEKYLLADVFGQLVVADDPERECRDGDSIGIHQDLERLIASPAAYAHEGRFLGRTIDAGARRSPDGGASGVRRFRIITPEGSIFYF
jgi:hypothetical protein